MACGYRSCPPHRPPLVLKFCLHLGLECFVASLEGVEFFAHSEKLLRKVNKIIGITIVKTIIQFYKVYEKYHQKKYLLLTIFQPPIQLSPVQGERRSIFVQHFEDGGAVFEGEEGGSHVVEFIFDEGFEVERDGGEALFLLREGGS